MITSRKSLRLLLLSTSIAALAIAAMACDGPGQPIDTSGEPPVPQFDDTFGGGAYLALQEENCGSEACHDAVAPGGNLILPAIGVTLSTQQAHSFILTGGLSGSSVNTANVGASLLLTKGAGTVGHTGGALWVDGDETYDAVESWIAAGALLN